MEGGDFRMSIIDQKIVSMKFDNAQFEQGVKTTLSSLQSLSKGLQLAGATKGLTDVSAAAKHVQLGHIATAVDGIARKFSAMSVVAVTAISNIANRAVTAGLQMVKGLSLDPVTSGLKEYETNLNSIQTILANTGLEGQAGLAKVNAALQKLNTYSDQTIFNFSEMARNIGTFTAAGVKLDVATSAIKGIANLAAVSGSNAQQASTAMYQLSQAISAGKLTLEDWNSVVNAGMGGKVFQNSLMETARIHGVAVDKMVKDSGSFRLSLQEGWLTGEILTETLSKFTGDLNAAQLKNMGYSKKQIAEILKMGKVAQDAATKVKTMSQLISTLQEAAGSGWAKTWQLIFGDFDEAKVLFTGVSKVLGGFIDASSDARNKVLGDWKALGGRTVLIDAISSAFKALMAVIKPIKDAFRSIFPATTGKQLFEITTAIRDFAKGLMIGKETAENLRRTFAGVFAVVGIAWDILKAFVSTIFRLVGAVGDGSGGFLEFTGNIGDFLVGIRKAIKDGNLITKVFDKIGDGLEFIINLIKKAVSFIGGLFDGFNGAKAANDVAGLASKLKPLGALGDIIAKVWSRVVSVFDNVMRILQPLGAKFSSVFKQISDQISGGINLDSLFSAIKTGAFVAFFLALKNLVGNVSGVFDGLTGTMQNMQNTLRAATLLQLAVAIGTLTLSMVALSKIDTGGLTRSLTAITVMFGQLFGMMLLFEKLSGFTGLAKMPLVAASLILLGVALRVLASSVKTLAELSWEDLAKGLTGVTVLLAALVVALKFMPDPKSMISTGLGLILLAAAIKILASAVTDLSGLSWEDMAKGLTGVGVLLGALTLFTKFSEANKGGLLSGAGLLLLAVAVKILASALEEFSGFSWEEIGRGLVAMVGSLAIVTAALLLIPPTAPLAAAGVLIVAISLGKVADALQDFGSMSWDSIGKGLTAMLGALTLISLALTVIPPTAPFAAAAILITAVALMKVADVLDQMGAMSWQEIGKAMTALAGSLLIIGVAVTAMTTAIPGAAALIIVAGALAILAPVLLLFGNMSWEEMGKGLLMLAGVFLVIGVAGLVLGPIVPILLGLGVAIVLLGVGMLAAGVGLLAFSAGLTALSIAGAAGSLAIVGLVAALAGVIPLVMTQIGLGIVAFAKVIATAGPAMYAAITAVLMAMIKAINTVSPQIISTMFRMLTLLLLTIRNYMPILILLGTQIVVSMLNGIRNNINRIVTAAVNLIVAFINAVSQQQSKVIQAGVRLIISFVNGLADAIRSNSGAMRSAGANLAGAIIDGMTGGLASGATRLANKAASVAKGALSAAMGALGVHSPSKEFFKLGAWSVEGLANGLTQNASMADRAAAGIGNTAIDALKASISKIADVVSADMELAPTIRPVLDLSDVKKNAGTIGGLLGDKTLNIGVTSSNAKDASNGHSSNQSQPFDPDDPRFGGAPPSVSYTQNNYSPKTLSPAEIYRQTKNQLSVTKGALAP
jgi:tape measure domain-containing protein